VPPGAVHQQDGLRARGDVTGYLVEMELHRFGVGLWQRERGAYSARWTDGTEQVSIFVALVGGRPRPAPGPLPHDAILLTDPGFILT